MTIRTAWSNCAPRLRANILDPALHLRRVGAAQLDVLAIIEDGFFKIVLCIAGVRLGELLLVHDAQFYGELRVLGGKRSRLEEILLRSLQKLVSLGGGKVFLPRYSDNAAR